jgi:hypothetical protein
MVTADCLGKKVRLAFSDGSTQGVGQAVGFCDAPMVMIQDEAGEQAWWRADMAEVLPAGLLLRFPSRK